MSMHAQLSPEVVARLKVLRRQSTVSAFVAALLTIALIGLLLAVFKLVPLLEPTPQIIGYVSPTIIDQPITEPITRTLQQRPSPPSAAAYRSIVAATASPTSIPIPDFDTDSLSSGFGSGDDFGEGSIGTGIGTGGSSSRFGSAMSISGSLKGRLYDFKQNRRGRPNDDMDVMSSDPYFEIVAGIQRRDFSEGSLSRYFKAPKELSLTHLAVPLGPADDAPKFFGAEKSMKPSGWLAHYHGTVVVPSGGRFRFAGIADDYMGLFIDGKTQLITTWPTVNPIVAGRWKPAEDTGRWKSPIEQNPLVFGDWVTLETGQEIQIDLAIGERPGGKIGFLLLVEKEGEEYRRTAEGRPVLPLFSTSLFTEESRADVLEAFPGFEFEWDRLALFPTR